MSTSTGRAALSVRLHDTRDSYRSAGSLCPTAFGLSGNQLTFVVSPPDDLFHLNVATEADVSTSVCNPESRCCSTRSTRRTACPTSSVWPSRRPTLAAYLVAPRFSRP